MNEFVYRLLKCYHQLLKIKTSRNQLTMDNLMGLQRDTHKEPKKKKQMMDNEQVVMNDECLAGDKRKDTKKKSNKTKKQKQSKQLSLHTSSINTGSHLMIGLSVGIVIGMILTKRMQIGPYSDDKR